jgi:uncharacterized hydrophobic protein (TIGR00271 family)
MYKLTAICPKEDTDAVVTALKADSGASHVVCIPSAATDGKGDVINAYLQKDASDGILRGLRRLRRWQPGDLALIDLALVNLELVSRAQLADGNAPEKTAAGDDDELAWDMILSRAVDETKMSWWYIVLLMMAGWIAAIGLLSNSSILIVGAMALSPDLAPVNATAVALNARATRYFFHALGTLIGGLASAIGFAFLGALCLHLVGLHEDLVASISQEATAFVTVVNHVTVTVAVTAGVAVMVAFVADQGTGVVGVAISVTTIPAAAYVGLALADAEFGLAGDALLVLAANVLCLTLAQVLTLIVIRWGRRLKLRFAIEGTSHAR